MAGDNITMSLSGFESVGRYLEGIEPKARARVVMPALRKAIKPMLADARRRVPVRHGLLKRSLGVRTKRYRGGRIVFAAVGPRPGFRYAGSFVVGGTHVVADPRKYAHLVEFGTRHSQAQAFMRPAFDAHSRSVVKNFGGNVQTQIEKIAARDARK